jgi:hypothetical protein
MATVETVEQTKSEKVDYGIRGALQVRNDGGVDVGIECVGFHDQQKNEKLQTQFGELCGIGTLRGDAWDSPTPQKTCRTCRLVHAYPRRRIS